MTKNKNITSDVLRGTGSLRKRLYITPSFNIAFDSRGDEVGRYCIKVTRNNALVLF